MFYLLGLNHYFSRDLSIYIKYSPTGYLLPAMLISTLFVSIFMLNLESDGICVILSKIPVSGLILDPMFGSLYRYNTIEAGSGHNRYELNRIFQTTFFLLIT